VKIMLFVRDTLCNCSAHVCTIPHKCYVHVNHNACMHCMQHMYITVCTHAYMYSCVHTCTDVCCHWYTLLVPPMYMMTNRRELFISHYFKRHFWWYECVMFPSYIPKNVLSNTTVFISEQDGILNPGKT
jgi:hypothetical protein